VADPVLHRPDPWPPGADPLPPWLDLRPCGPDLRDGVPVPGWLQRRQVAGGWRRAARPPVAGVGLASPPMEKARQPVARVRRGSQWRVRRIVARRPAPGGLVRPPWREPDGQRAAACCAAPWAVAAAVRFCDGGPRLRRLVAVTAHAEPIFYGLSSRWKTFFRLRWRPPWRASGCRPPV